MYGCESWTVKKAPKNWCFWIVLEKTLESPLDCKKIQPVHPKGDHSWVFIGRTDAEAETPILWPPHEKNWLIGKDPDAGRDWGQEEKGATGWDGWMASLTWWTRVWVNSRRCWWTGCPGVLRFVGLQRVGHDWVTGLNWTELNWVRQMFQWNCFFQSGFADLTFLLPNIFPTPSSFLWNIWILSRSVKYKFLKI